MRRDIAEIAGVTLVHRSLLQVGLTRNPRVARPKQVQVGAIHGTPRLRSYLSEDCSGTLTLPLRRLGGPGSGRLSARYPSLTGLSSSSVADEISYDLLNGVIEERIVGYIDTKLSLKFMPGGDPSSTIHPSRLRLRCQKASKTGYMYELCCRYFIARTCLNRRRRY